MVVMNTRVKSPAWNIYTVWKSSSSALVVWFLRHVGWMDGWMDEARHCMAGSKRVGTWRWRLVDMTQRTQLCYMIPVSGFTRDGILGTWNSKRLTHIL